MKAHIMLFTLDLSTTTIINIFIIFIVCTDCKVNAYGYHECSSPLSSSCGNIPHIGYPFWGNGRPQYCGYPPLQLLCPDTYDYPVLQISDQNNNAVSFQVLNISSSDMYNSHMIIKLRQLHPYYTCPFDIYSNNVFNNLLSFNTNVSIIALFYDCSASARINSTGSGSGSELVTCSHINTPTVTSYYLRNLSDLYMPDERIDKDCHHYNIPVFREELNELRDQKESLEAVLAKGFEVDFNNSACIKCRKSGGACGSSDDQMFVCYCKDDSPSYDVCPKSKKWKGRLILALGSSGGGLVILSVLVFYYVRIRPITHFAIFSKRRAAQHQNIEAFLKIYGSLAPKRYTYANIRKMTNYFKDKLGEGGYAIVYKGKLPNGRLVAVKLLKQVKGNGEDFVNEVASISRTNHVNIVALLGFCFEGRKRALISEFMSNGSLERFTYRGASYMSLSWETMFDIALGIAKGLDYLHRGCNARILHFDIKPHNILLDNEFHPKISDFGLARLCSQQESSISMLEARGTIGYIAPEVFCRNFGGVSHKSDVYSYGMMILDLICERTNTTVVHNNSEMYFPQWIYDRLELGEEVVLRILNDKEKEMQRKMILVSLWCIQTYPSNRPSMSRVTEMLTGCLESIQMPPKPYVSAPPKLVSYTSGKPTTS